MTRSFRGLTLLLFATLLVAGAGCTKKARMERHLARGNEQAAAGEYAIAEAEYRAALRLVAEDPAVLGRLGILYENNGRVLPAYLMLEQALKGRPDDADLRLAFGLASLSLAKTANARAAAKKVLETLPTREEAILLLAETCVTSRDNAEARRIIEQLRDQHPNLAAYSIASGTLHLAQRDPGTAETEFKKALQLDPKSAAAHAYLGNYYLARGEIKEAAGFLKTAADLSPLRSVRRIKYIDFLFRTGSYDEAKSEITKITAKAPDYVPAWGATMRLAFVQKQYDACNAAADKILSIDRNNYEALMQRAAVKLLKEDFDGVISDLKQIEGYYPTTSQVKYQLALAHLKKTDLPKAESYLAQAIALSPNFDEAILLSAELNLRKGNIAPVISTLTQLLKRKPRTGRAYILLAQAHRAQGNLAESLNLLRAVAATAPGNPEGPYLVGMVLVELKQRAEAKKLFEQSVLIAEDYWPALEMLVDDDLVGNRPAAAASRVETLLQKYPKAVQPWLFRAKIRLLTGDTKGGESDLLQAIELEPRAAHPYLLLARLYFEDNRGKEALEKLVAVAEKTNSLPSLMQLGMLRTALKQYDGARIAYEKLLTLDPRFGPALNNLAVLYNENLGQPDKALAFATKAKELTPNDPIAMDTLGWILFRKNQYETALPLLQAAADKMAGEPEVQYHLGMTYYYLGQEDTARQLFSRIASATADFRGREDAQKRLAVLSIDISKADSAIRAELEQRVQQDAHDPIVLARLAAIEEREGAFARAAEHYETALKAGPRSVPVMMALVQAYFGPLQKPERARELAKSARVFAPNDSKVAWKLGKMLLKTGDFAWSTSLLQEAARDPANQPDVLLDLAQASYGIGRVTEAIETLQPLLKIEGFALREPTQRMIAMIAAAKSPAEALAAQPEARKLLAADPDYVPALMVSGLAQEQLKDYKAARQTYDRIVTTHPLFAPALRQLAILYAQRLGDDKKAEEFAVKARQAFPDDPELAFELGAVNYRREEYAAAVRFFQQSLRKRDNHAETLFFLGLCYYQLKNSPESRAALQRALALNLPDQEANEAARVLAELSRNG